METNYIYYESSDSTSTFPEIIKFTSIRKAKFAILGIWFVLLVGIRLLMGLLPTAAWIGTIGAVAIALVIFYIALRYTRFAKYSTTVNVVLQEWYKKKFILPALIFSMLVLGGLMFLAEVGYSYHSDKLITVDNLDSANSLYTARREFSSSLRSLFAQGYSGFDGLAVLLASIDKSLDGHYMRAVSFILAEDIEILAFLLAMKKTGRSIFGAPLRHPGAIRWIKN